MVVDARAQLHGEDASAREGQSVFQEEPDSPVLRRRAEESYDGNLFYSFPRPVEDDFTITLQFKTSSLAGSSQNWMSGVGLLDSSVLGSKGDFGLTMGDGKVMFGIDAPDKTITSSQSLADDKWHTVVANRDKSTGAFTLWVDGVFQSTISGSTKSLRKSNHTDVGRLHTGHGYFVGSLRDIEIYNQVLTPTDIDGAKEKISKKRHAADYQSVYEMLPATDFVGDTYRGLRRMIQDDFTIRLDFLTQSNDGDADHWWQGVGLVDAGVPGAADDFGLTMGDGRVMFGIGNPDTTIVSGRRYNDGRWHTVVASRQKKTGEFSLWIDGELQEGKVGSLKSLTSSRHLDIGRLAHGVGYFVGSLRKLRIFDQPLTPIDLGLEAQTGEPGPLGGLLAQLDGGEAPPSTGATLPNASFLSLRDASKASSGCPGIVVGDRFIQMGSFRLSDADGSHFSIASQGGKTAMVYREDGSQHPGPRGDFQTWSRQPGAAQGVTMGDRFIQIGKWRLGDVDGRHFSIAHERGWTAQIFRSDGTVHPGPRNDLNTLTRKVGTPKDISFGDRFIEIGAWRLGAPDATHLSISHYAGKTAMVFRADGSTFPGSGRRTDYSTWQRPNKICSITALRPCRGLIVGDRFIQMGNWRLGDFDGARLTMSHNGGETAEVWYSSGDTSQTKQTVSRKLSTWPRVSGTASEVFFGDRFVQLGEWRLGEIDKHSFVVAHVDGETAQVFTSRGKVTNSPSMNYPIWLRATGEASGISFGERFLEIGRWRIGEVDGQHASVVHQSGHVALIFKSDGTTISGPRRAFSTLANPVEMCDLLAPKVGCVFTLDNPSEQKRRYSSTSGQALSYLDSKKAWSPQTSKQGEWIQMDLGSVKKVAGAIMQSSFDRSEKHWVSKYRVKYSTDGRNWLDSGGVYPGDTSWFWKTTQSFPAAVDARYLRVFPEEWHRMLAMRVGMLVCQECPGGTTVLNPPESQRSYTSVKGKDKKGQGHARSMLLSPQAWSPAMSKVGQYMQVDLGRVRLVTAVVTQGGQDSSEWVTKYGVLCSEDGKMWNEVGPLFLGNRDAESKVQNDLPYAAFARYVRILPGDWKKAIALRMGVVVCQAPKPAAVVVPAPAPTPRPARTLASVPEPPAPPRPPAAGSLRRHRRHGAKHHKAKHHTARHRKATQPTPSPASSSTSVPQDEGFRRNLPKIHAAQALVGMRKKRHPLEPRPKTKVCRVEGVVNPREAHRTYSSVTNRSVPGSGNARSKLGTGEAWVARHHKKGQWLELDLTTLHKVAGVVTQGRQSQDQWVTKYQVKYSQDRKTWTDIGSDFDGNEDRTTPVQNEFPKSVVARYVRIIVIAWHGQVSMRAGVVACKGCKVGGMENPTEQMRSYSSVLSNAAPGTGAARSMLDSNQAWSAAKNSLHEWLQIDAGALRQVMGVTIQGRKQAPQWVTKFKVMYSEDGKTWMDVEGHFAGSMDSDTKVSTEFPQPVKARYVRILALEWFGHISMRAGLLMCKVFPKFANRDFELGARVVTTFRYMAIPAWSAGGQTVLIHSGNGDWGGTSAVRGDHFLGLRKNGSSISQTVGNHVPGREYHLKFRVAKRNEYPTPRLRVLVDGKELKRMEPGFTIFSQITVDYVAQSESVKMMFENVGPVNDNTAFLDDITIEEACHGGPVVNPPEVQRFYSSVPKGQKLGAGLARSMLDSPQAWCAAKNTQHQWMQIDLQAPMHISGAITQGREQGAQFVSKYEVQYSVDGLWWRRVGESFDANDDGKSKVTNNFPRSVVARYVRLLPITWNARISMRVGLTLCKAAGAAGEQSLVGKEPIPTTRQEPARQEPLPPPLKQWPGAALERRPRKQAPRRRAQLLRADAAPASAASRSAGRRLKMLVRRPKSPAHRPRDSSSSQHRKAHSGSSHHQAEGWPRLESPASTQKAAMHRSMEKELPTSASRTATKTNKQEILDNCPGFVENPSEDQRSYSSVYDGDQPGKMHARSMLDSDQAWSAQVSKPGEWMQIDLGEFAKVVATVVQGRKDWAQWVTAYKVRCSTDGVKWTDVQKDFRGSSDQNTKVTNYFPAPITARYVRFVVLSYHSHASMRAAVISCKETCSGVLNSPPEKDRKYSGVDGGHEAGHGNAQSKLNSPQAWTAGTDRAGQWMQMDLGRVRNIVSTLVQGHRSKKSHRWVTAYRVMYSEDGGSWKDVGKVFKGNTEGAGTVRNDFPHLIAARYVRLVVESWHGRISMRAGVMVCQGTGEPAAGTPRRRRSKLTNHEQMLEERGYKKCAKEGQDCPCSGIAVYGRGGQWRSLRVDGKVLCSAREFEDPVTRADRECRCRSLAWCLAAERKGSTTSVHDSAHRRRVKAGTSGRGLYQRRRECGWGPRDCIFGPWTGWGACSQECQQQRTRTVHVKEANGGACHGKPIETRQCTVC